MSLRNVIANAVTSAERLLWSTERSLDIPYFLKQSCLNGHRDTLAGKSVLILTADQLTTAAILIELDGIASRLLACPPGIQPDHLATIAAHAKIDAIVTTREQPITVNHGTDKTVVYTHPPSPSEPNCRMELDTEWLLLTSGTSGVPKIVRHTFRSLTGAIRPDKTMHAPPVWGTFYDIRRYGGLQIFLRAIVGGTSMVLSDASESVSDFLVRLSAHGVTHMSGTPSHWRRALMSRNLDGFTPSYVRLSGEIADKPLLGNLRAAFPKAAIAHAYASTEAGIGFVVDDELEGFPASVIGKSDISVEIKVVDDTLRIRSPLTATDYVGDNMPRLKDQEGFVDSGDVVEQHADRYYFIGRRGGIANVGGFKVHPEEVEAAINLHPAVQMSLVKAHKNPFTGSVIIAHVVVKASHTAIGKEQLRSEILTKCHLSLPPHKVPAVVRFVETLDIADSGKLVRTNA
jgi:acyl-coenzyme A synthetase/AMP-(fatty) acid ligase